MYNFYLLCVGELDPDFISRNIQKFLSEKHGRLVNWSHCAIEVEPICPSPAFDYEQAIWDSTGRGFEPCSMDEVLDHGAAVIRHRIPLPVKDPEEAMGWLRGNRGRGYSNLQYVPFLMPSWLRKVFKAITPKIIRHQFMNGRRRAVCSETIGYFMRDNHPTAHSDVRLKEDAIDLLDPYMAGSVAALWSPDFSPSEWEREWG